MTREDFDYEFARQGFVKVEGAVASDLVPTLRAAVDEVVDVQSQRHLRGDFAHLIHTASDKFLVLLNDPPLWPLVKHVLGNEAVLHSFGAVRLQPTVSNPIQNAIHRDTPRFYRPDLLTCQTLIMVDDFTPSNGATWVLPGSHQIRERPTDEQFGRGAIQITGSAGDVVLFDSLLWHKGGSNETATARRGITMVFSRSFIKPQFDMPRTISEDARGSLGPIAKQLLGLRSDPPRNLEEYLLPEDRRSYVAKD